MLQQWKQETHWSLHDPILLTDKGCNFSSKMSNDLSESLRRWKTSVNTLNSRISSGWRNKQAPTCSWYGNKWLTWHWKDSTGEANKWWFHATESLHIKRVSLNTEKLYKNRSSPCGWIITLLRRRFLSMNWVQSSSPFDGVFEVWLADRVVVYKDCGAGAVFAWQQTRWDLQTVKSY